MNESEGQPNADTVLRLFLIFLTHAVRKSRFIGCCMLSFATSTFTHKPNFLVQKPRLEFCGATASFLIHVRLGLFPALFPLNG